MKTNRNPFARFSIASTYAWAVLLAALPLSLMLAISLFSYDEIHFYKPALTLTAYKHVFNWLYIKVFLNSVLYASITTFSCLLIAYPFSYFLTQMPKRSKPLLILLVMVPFWTSSLIRTYSIVAILKAKGIINTALIALGLINEPIRILYTNVAVFIGLVYDLLPFMIIPLFISLDKIDPKLLEAARDLGSNKWQRLKHITLPLSRTGIFSGCIMVFLPAMTLFYIPDLLGGAKTLLLGNLINSQFAEADNWPLGAALSVLLTTVLMMFLWLSKRRSQYD